MSFLCLGDLKKEKPGRNKVGEKVLNDRRMKIRMLMMYLCMCAGGQIV